MNLIRRSTLYPALQDHDLVKEYPSVQGMAKDVFFLDHRHPEDGAGGEDSVSKTNTYEVGSDTAVGVVAILTVILRQVDMIKDLVMYFLR